MFGSEAVFVDTRINSVKNAKKTSIEENATLYSSKKLGSFIENGKTYFRLFAPNALAANLYVFDNVEDSEGRVYPLTKFDDGVWEFSIKENLIGKFYGFRLQHINDVQDISEKPLCIDPYAKAVATYTSYFNPRKSIVYEEDYDWDEDKWIQRDWRDLIIYEMHVRDMTAHPSSKSEKPGTYNGLIDENAKGGINYIKKLGVNTVELLPAQDFGYCEAPYKEKMNGKFNTWNPYERNHWGYMTAAYFAPASYYAQDWDKFKWNEWIGGDAKQVNQFKDMVKAFHKNKIAVIMDVVYNHLSEYEIGNLKEIDKEYYFRLDEKGNFIAESYCGNDLKTEAPMTRRLIIDSILYWMKDYHVDGFRFDLGKLLDWETIEAIIHEARKINPNVVFVCEPWGGGYDPKGFSLRDWASWNDQIRNGIKGENPKDGLGWIFGNWFGNNNYERIKSYVRGTLVRDSLGLFQRKEHSVNYLASHDGYTLGDFIRIGNKSVKPDQIIKNIDKNAALDEKQLKQNKLAALFLLTSQGLTMIHSGQEFARSKVIPINAKIDDKHQGMIDHNSYEKDNEVNYINYDHADKNQDLIDYYGGLIELRKAYRAFRYANYDEITFYPKIENEFALGYTIDYHGDQFVVLFNADQSQSASFKLPDGEWELVVNSEEAGIKTLNRFMGTTTIEPISGAVFRKPAN
ncbi:MAG: pullulanase [Melioribacteraceae bacterium]|nr:pullulanase [Melioribacteraceae bacterium]MCF8264306.1 pullulanase [Melioribacteraceae bacterium]MCF8431417.1 pullulanase [Melioribacteraceae bacterium]